MAKAAYWTVTDVEARKRGEQTGLDTLVVANAVNDEYRCRVAEPFGAVANAVSIPPGEYVRKNETQRN